MDQERGKRGACIDPSGYDAGQKIEGSKWHIRFDTVDLLLHAVVHPTEIQDRVGGVLRSRPYSFLLKLFADAWYQGPEFATAVAGGSAGSVSGDRGTLGQASGFVLLPMRRVVERSLTWLNRCRRLAEDFEDFSRNTLA